MAKQKRTYFTKSDLVSFGNYVLSEQRERRIKEAKGVPHHKDSLPPSKDRLREVNSADFHNWKEANSL